MRTLTANLQPLPSVRPTLSPSTFSRSDSQLSIELTDEYGFPRFEVLSSEDG